MFTTNPRTKPDFSVRAYEQFMPARSRTNERVARAIRALGRGAATVMLRVVDAIYESRRRQAAAVFAHYDDLIHSGAHALRMPQHASERRSAPHALETCAGNAVYGMRIRCSITGAPCEGDQAHLCIEWGCARKGGLSPISHENFS
jgi:hypothetical protein